MESGNQDCHGLPQAWGEIVRLTTGIITLATLC